MPQVRNQRDPPKPRNQSRLKRKTQNQKVSNKRVKTQTLRWKKKKLGKIFLNQQELKEEDQREIEDHFYNSLDLI